MDKITGQPIAQKINRVFLVGAAVLIVAYGLLFKTSILVTENKNSMHRLVLVAPHYFKQYKQGLQGKQVIDPLLTGYDDYKQLPAKIKKILLPNWTGIDTLHFDDESEVAIFAQQHSGRTLYLVENINATEWSDNAFILIEVIIFSCGIILFLLASIVIKNKAIKISKPFSKLAKQLSIDSGEEFNKISTDGVSSLELRQTLSAINSYREKIAFAIAREQSFTRYVSHELRTPMTVIKGSVSVLKKQDNPQVDKQCLRINHAVDEMQALTQTFLLLARGELNTKQILLVNNALVEKQLQDLSSYITSNQCNVSVQILDEVQLPIEEVLFTALVKNLLINAINSTPNGNVDIFIEQKQMTIVDSGTGLDHQSRGYEGFGIGLVLVRDICHKYHWSFSLENNEQQGCKAKVVFS